MALATGGAIGRTYAQFKSHRCRVSDPTLDNTRNARSGARKFPEVCNSCHPRPTHRSKGIRTRHAGSRSHRTHRCRTENSLVEQPQIIAENHEPKSPHNLTPQHKLRASVPPKRNRAQAAKQCARSHKLQMIYSTPAHPRASLHPRPYLSWASIRLAIICLDREELREWLTRRCHRAPRA